MLVSVIVALAVLVVFLLLVARNLTNKDATSHAAMEVLAKFQVDEMNRNGTDAKDYLQRLKEFERNSHYPTLNVYVSEVEKRITTE